MDVIYSRHRLRKQRKRFNNPKIKKINKFLIIIFIAILTMSIMIKSINPIFEELCIERVINIATTIINEESNSVLKNNDYSQIVEILKNEENITNIVKTNVVLINEIASDITLRIENRFKNLENEKIKIPIGALTGSKFFAGSGPGIGIKIIQTQSIKSELKTEFETQGINQTVYRIFLELKASVNIITPYKTINKEITNQILLVETVILGNVPETYYNLEGIDSDGSMNLIN